MRVTAGLLLVGLLPGIAAGAGFEFEKVADTSSEAPGDVADFVFFAAPSLDGETVAFAALADRPAIWARRDGDLEAVAPLDAGLPERLDGSRSFGLLSLAGDQIAFPATLDDYGPEELYLAAVGGEGLLTLVSRDTPAPGAGSAFLAFEDVWLGEDALAFHALVGRPGPTDAIYLARDHELRLVVDEQTAVPGGDGEFRVLREPALDGDLVYFRGKSAAAAGVYAWRDGEGRALVDTRTLVPDSRERFRSFEFLSARGGTLAFSGRGQGRRRGVYWSGDRLVRVADTRTPVPGVPGRFTGFTGVSVDGAAVVFAGQGKGRHEGVYLWDGTRPRKVIARGDLLDGRRVSSVEIGRQALSDGRVAFLAGFEGGEQGIFVAVPPPAPPAAREPPRDGS